jgi:hypothetical protein
VRVVQRMDDDSSEHGTVDVGNLNAILTAVETGNRKRLFPIPDKLRPSRREVEALPIAQRQAMYEPLLMLRCEIDRAKCGYRTRNDLNHILLTHKRGEEITRKAKTFSKLFTKDAAGKAWAIVLSDIVAQLDKIEARVAEQFGGPTVIRDTQESALDWLVLHLADVFQSHFGKEAKRSYAPGPDGDEYYGPFIAFVLEVAKEGNFKIEPSTIHRTISAGAGMGRRTRKK